MKRTCVWLAVVLLGTAWLAAVTPPEKFLGYPVGADRKLADYGEIRAYFQLLAQESPDIKIVELGKTTQGQDMFMAVITHRDNMPRLAEFVGQSRRLRDAAGLSEADARQIARTGKPIVLATGSIHATEIAANQMSMELAYKLVTGQTPYPQMNLLQDVIFLLIPSINPDGQKLVVDWYRKYVGTKFEGGYIPYLYHPYAGHDDNRDWFMYNLVETRLVTKVLFEDCLPQVHIDEHQMGSTGARLFLPPFDDPPTPQVPPLVWRQAGLIGMGIAADMEQQGFRGITHGSTFTGWWIGACDDTSWFHNVIGLLSELASARLGTPIYVEPGEVQQPERKQTMSSPSPWKGGWWRPRDLVDYELALNFALLKAVALHKEDILYNFYKMNRDAIEQRPAGSPYAYLIPPDQWDPPTALKMMEILKTGGVIIHQADEPFRAAGREYPAGTFILYTAQPYRPYLDSLMQKQKYPDTRRWEGGPPVPPYDNAAWTLPYQMGVKWEAVSEPFQAKATRMETFSFPAPPPSAADSGVLLLSARENDAYGVAARLLQQGVAVYRATQGGDSLAAGDFLVPLAAESAARIRALAAETRLQARSLPHLPAGTAPVKLPRVGIYQPWLTSMDEGWTRLLLDRFGFPFTVLHNADIQAGKLRDKLDVLILADIPLEALVNAKPEHPPYESFTVLLPPEFEGGIGDKGTEAIKEFVKAGGRLACFNHSSDFAIKTFQLPVVNTLAKLTPEQFICPTSLLRIQVTDRSPLGWGMPADAVAMFAGGLAFQTWVPSGDTDRRIVAVYPEEEILASGWLTGEKYLTQKAAVVDFTVEKGKVFLYGIRPQHRCQTHGTFKLLFNALLWPEAAEAAAPAVKN